MPAWEIIVPSEKIGAWWCRILYAEDVGYVAHCRKKVTWRRKRHGPWCTTETVYYSKEEGLMIPAMEFERCEREIFEKYKLPKKVVDWLLEKCTKLR